MECLVRLKTKLEYDGLKNLSADEGEVMALVVDRLEDAWHRLDARECA